MLRARGWVSTPEVRGFVRCLCGGLGDEDLEISIPIPNSYSQLEPYTVKI